MDVLKTIHKKISNQKMKSKERDKSILEYVQCMYNNEKRERDTGEKERERDRERTISRETEVGETDRERGMVGERKIGIDRERDRGERKIKRKT